MGYTPVYNWYYLEPNTNTGSVVWEEFKRWSSLETQIFELYSLFGNGVLSGWEIEPQSNGNIIFVTPGSGHVGYKSAITIERSEVTLQIPPDSTIPNSGIKYYIYGKENSTTNIDRSIEFFSSTIQLTYSTYNTQVSSGQQLNPGGLIRIGEVVLKPTETGSYEIEAPTYNTRDNISLFDNLSNYIKNHIHIGGANNPSKINLYRHVTGKLSGDMIDWLDASLVTKGKIDSERLPKFNHEDLDGIGSLTHSDIDNIILSWSLDNENYLGDVFGANEIKLIMALKHIYETIDETLINTIIYIPGLTTTEWEDADNTTAIIDRDNHIIYGTLASPASSNFISWNTADEFQEEADKFNLEISDFPDSEQNVLDKLTRSQNIQITDEGVYIDKILSIQTIHNINEDENTNDWIQVSKVINNNSFGKNTGSFGIDVNFGYFMFKLFTAPGTTSLEAQDWTGSSKLQFSFKLDSDSEDYSEHGDIYMFLLDAPPIQIGDSDIEYETLEFTNIAGRIDKVVANSGIKIISNGDLTDGFTFIDVDLSQFNGLNTVNGIGFYTLTGSGWNPSKPFYWEIKQPEYSNMIDVVSDYLKVEDPNKYIAVYRYNDNIYEKNGFIKLRFNTPTLSSWEYLSVVKNEPDYSGQGVLPTISVYTKVASDEEGLYTATSKSVTATTQEDLYTINQEKSYWIEIEVKFAASGDRYLTPTLNEINLYYSTSHESSSKTWADYSSWFDYDELININIAENPDRIELNSYNNVQSIYFIENNSIKTTDKDGNDIDELFIDGSTIPQSPIQAFFKCGSGFIHPSKVEKTNIGNYLISDSGNDRILEIDGNKDIVRIIQGNSYLGLIKRDFVVLNATYNSRLGQVAITFSQVVSISNLNLEKFSLISESGINKINLGNSSFATPKMMGSALNGNMVSLDKKEWTTMSSLVKDSTGKVVSYDSLDLGTEVQSGCTIIPGIGKSSEGSLVSDNLGSVLLFDLASATKSIVNSWGGSKKILITSGAYLGGGLGGADTNSIASDAIPSAQWFDAEKDNSDEQLEYKSGTNMPTDAFYQNYNPFIQYEGSFGNYEIPDLQTETANLSFTNNLYTGLPYIEYEVSNTNYYITEPRYNLPGILVRNNSSYNYPIITDVNDFYDKLKLTKEQWMILADYDEDSSINQTTLKDLDGNTSNLELLVDEVDIIYWDILHPISVQKDENDYIIAQANKYSIVKIDLNGDMSWGILDNVVNFAIGDYGSAKLMDNGNLLIASPVMNIIGELVIENQSIVDNITTIYSPIDVYKNDDNFIILLSQRTNNSTNSRAYEISQDRNVLWEWGLNRLKLPTGISKLDNGNIIISC